MLLAQVAMFALAAGHGGSYTALALPATASRQLLVPAVIALFFALRRATFVAGARDVGGRGRGAGARPPDLRALRADPARRLRGRPAGPRPDGARGGSAGPGRRRRSGGTGRPLAAPDRPRDGFGEPVRGRAHPGAPALPEPARRLLGRQLPPRAGGASGGRGRSPCSRSFAVPLAVLAARRRWGAFVLGGFLAVLALVLLPTLFTHFADAVSISQARRAAGFVPFPFAVAGGAAVLARLLSLGALPVGLGAGIAFQLAYPGDFGYALDDGGPALATWVALFGAAAALVRRSLPAAPADRARPRGTDRRRDRRAGDPAGRAARLHPLGRAPDRRPRPDPRARPGAARPCAREGGRLLRRRDELRDRGLRARLRRRRPAGPRRRHEGEPAVRATSRRPRVLPHRRTWRSRAATGRPGWSSTGTARSAGSTSRRCTPTRGMSSTVSAREGPARLHVLPAGRRRRRPAHAEDGHPPARARDRDPRPRARRPEVGPPRRRARAADPGVGPPRALHRPPRTPAGAGAARQAGPRAGRHPGQALRPAAAGPRRERHLEPDRDPGGDPDRQARGHRRRPHHLAAQLGALRRRGGEARDRHPLGRRPPRLARRPPAPARRRAAAGPDQGAGRARRRGAGRGLRRRDRRRCRRHRRGGTRLRAERPRGDDRERRGLRRLRRTGAPTLAALPDHAHRQLLRPARPEAVHHRAGRVRTRRDRAASSATSGRPTASGPKGSVSATGSSSSRT